MAGRKTRAVRINKQAIRSYQKQVDKQADAARDYMSRALDAYMRQYPDASVAQVRKFTYELMHDALPNFTDIAETLSCDFMEAVAEEHGWDDVKPEIVGSTDFRMVDKRLHYLAGHLANGDAEKYREGVLDVTRFYIKRSAQDAMVANCDKASLRYARVPSGFETCAFCFMLASRGFVYSSELKAGLGHSYHPNCNCTVVPGAKGRTAIDGYDPEGMRKRWEACAQTIGSHDADAVMKEVATRDWHWLYTGKPLPEPKREAGAKPKKKEEKTEKLLRAHGFRIMFRNDQNQEGRTSDTFFIDRKQGESATETKWEFKCPDGSSDKAVKNQLKNAVGRNGKSQQCERVVISNASDETTLTFEKLCDQMQELYDANRFIEIKEVLIVSTDGRIRRWIRK